MEPSPCTPPLIIESFPKTPRTQSEASWFSGSQRMCHTMALPFCVKKSILMQKKNYGNSNMLACKNIIFKKSSKKETKILQDIITL
jgi:hypothetical protein